MIGFKPPLSRREAWILKFFDSSGPLSAGKYVQILGFFWILQLPRKNMYKFLADMRFVKNFTSLDFQAKNFTPLISPNFNSFGDDNTKKKS